MPTQEQKAMSKHNGKSVDGRELAEQDSVAQAKDHKFKDTLDATDDLLSEIDEVLADTLAHETAAEFVAGYKQKGGE